MMHTRLSTFLYCLISVTPFDKSFVYLHGHFEQKQRWLNPWAVTMSARPCHRGTSSVSFSFDEWLTHTHCLGQREVLCTEKSGWHEASSRRAAQECQLRTGVKNKKKRERERTRNARVSGVDDKNRETGSWEEYWSKGRTMSLLLPYRDRLVKQRHLHHTPPPVNGLNANSHLHIYWAGWRMSAAPSINRFLVAVVKITIHQSHYIFFLRSSWY